MDNVVNSKKKTFGQFSNKKVMVSLFLILGIVLIGTSFALWQITFTQSGTNVITTGCFKIEYSDKNHITIDNAYPVTDEDGKKPTPYEVTITNTCNSEADYYVNLETVTSAEKKLSEEYLRASLRKEDTEVFLNNLSSSYINLDKVIEEASTAYKLYQGKLKAKEVVTFYLNLWLDDKTEANNSVMDASYEGKITISSSYRSASIMSGVMKKMDYGYAGNASITHGIRGGDVNTTYYGENGEYMDTLTKVVFQDTITPFNDAIEIKDFSEAQDESVLGYYVPTGEKNVNDKDIYNLYIQANGKIKVNPIASYYFSDYSIMDPGYYYFTGNLLFEGIENLDTSLVVDMSNMFYNISGMEELDLSTFDTSNVTNMSGMFRRSWYLDDYSKLKTINLSSFDTRNVIDMSYMFSGCSGITSLDLSNFDTSNVRDMSYMFAEHYDNYSYKLSANLDLSHFNTSQVINMDGMFKGYSSLMTTIIIMNSNTSYSNMFSGVATEDGAQVAINYTSETEELVDKMIAEKPDGSNVVKGTLVS